jgi:hypothetical protein
MIGQHIKTTGDRIDLTIGELFVAAFREEVSPDFVKIRPST